MIDPTLDPPGSDILKGGLAIITWYVWLHAQRHTCSSQRVNYGRSMHFYGGCT